MNFQQKISTYYTLHIYIFGYINLGHTRQKKTAQIEPPILSAKDESRTGYNRWRINNRRSGRGCYQYHYYLSVLLDTVVQYDYCKDST